MTNPPFSFVLTSRVPRTRDDLADRELLRRLASGRHDALGELYDKHAAPLFRHALALTRRRDQAEDLVQAVFVKLATIGPPLLGVRTPANYLHRMLKTTWLDGQRRTIVGERVVEQSTAGLAETRVPNREDAIDLGRALDDLPPLQREVVVLHLIEGFSFLEVGRRSGVSLFTAAARYRLAIARLRKALGPKGKA